MAESTFIPKKSLRENPLKRALKSMIVCHVINKYMTVGIRVLWDEKDYSTMWEKREVLEGILKQMKEVVFIIDCITAMKESKEKMTVGYSFWICFDFPEHTSEMFENRVSKAFINAGVKIASCKSIKGRGKNIETLLHVVTRCYTLLHLVTRCYTFFGFCYTLLHVVTCCYTFLTTEISFEEFECLITLS